MNPGILRKDNTDSFYQNKNSDTFRNLDKNRLKNQSIKDGSAKSLSTSSLFFSQLSSFKGNFSLKSALPFDLPIRENQEKLNFDQNNSLKELHHKPEEKNYGFDSTKKIEEKEINSDKAVVDQKEKVEAATKDDGKHSKEIIGFLLDLKKNLASLNDKNDFSGNIATRINSFLERINQLSLKNHEGGINQLSVKDHVDLKKFLQNVLDQIAGSNGKMGNIQNATSEIQKSLEGLLQRYQAMKVEGKLLDTPVVTSSMVQKEKLEGILNNGNRNGSENISSKLENFNENLNQKVDKNLLLKTTRHYSQGMQTPVNIGVMSQNRYNAMLQLKGGAGGAGGAGSAHFSGSSVARGGEELGVTRFARGKSQAGQMEKGWGSFRNSSETKFGMSGKNIGVLGSSNVKNGLFTGGNSLSSEMPLSASQSQRVMDRIVGKVSHHYRAGQETFSLKLQPKELGNVDVWMKKQDGKVNLRLTVESLSVKEAVESRLLDITNQLAQNGVELSALEVQVENQNHKKGEGDTFSLKDQTNLNETKKAEEDKSGVDILESMQWSLSGALQRFYA